MRWALVGMVALVGLAAGCSAGKPKSTPIIGGPATTWDAGVHKAPLFTLRDQNGKTVSLAAYRGRPVVITFLDPLCRNYCPIEATRLESVVRSLPAAARPNVIAVSVNVFGNARRYLVQDLHKWQLGPEWRWAVGTPAQLGGVWKRYDIGVLDQSKKIAGVVVHNIVHTEAAYVVDANGYERALYLWPFTAADVKATLTGLAG
jgi:protein SCO1